MSIASAFNEITVAQGGTASKTGSIAGAIDKLNDVLAGSDQPGAETIEQAIRLLGQHIGGGSSVTVEALTATENKTYTAPDGKAYSPVTVNVSGGSSDFAIANVTISATESGQYGFLYSVVADISESYGLEAGTLPPILQYLDFDLPTEAQIFEVYMYQGNALFAINIPEQDVTLTGNATKHGYDVDDVLTVVTITGDCTIVVTPESNG